MCARYTCPVCGYDGLEEPTYYENFAGSNEICACCGFEFGVDDFDCDAFEHEGLTEREIVEESHRIWREKWTIFKRSRSNQTIESYKKRGALTI